MLAREEHPVVSQEMILETLKTLKTTIEPIPTQITAPESRFLLGVIATLISTEEKILPQIFLNLSSYEKKISTQKFAEIFYEDYELISLKSYAADEASTYPLTPETIKQYDRRKSDAHLFNTHAIIYYQKKIYQYNRATNALTPITEPTGPEQKQKYKALINSMSNANLYGPQVADPTQRTWIAACTSLGSESQKRKISAAFMSDLLHKIHQDIESVAEDYKKLRLWCIQESIKTALLMIGGLTLQNGITMLVHRLAGHTIPMFKFILITQYIVAGGVAIAALGLGFACYYHWRHQIFKQLEMEIQQQINKKNSSAHPSDNTEYRNIPHFFNKNTQILEPLIHSVFNPAPNQS